MCMYTLICMYTHTRGATAGARVRGCQEASDHQVQRGLRFEWFLDQADGRRSGRGMHVGVCEQTCHACMRWPCTHVCIHESMRASHRIMMRAPVQRKLVSQTHKCIDIQTDTNTCLHRRVCLQCDLVPKDIKSIHNVAEHYESITLEDVSVCLCLL